MARKNVVRGYKMFDAQSIASNVTSDEVNVINLDKASIYLEWTGAAPVGAVVVEAKNRDNGDWFALDFGLPIAISGASGDHVLLLLELPHETIRLQYNSTSGTGNLTATFVGKQVGG
jgi:hypothetical protein